MTQKNRIPRTVGKKYVVKVNGDVAFSSESLKEARAFIASMIVNDSIQGVSIVKETLTETVLTNFTPQTQKVLVAADLGADLLDDEEIANV